MVELGVLTRTGELRHTRYHLPFPIGKVPRFTVEESGEVKMNGVTEQM
jgi:hypothetical protein